MRFQSFLGIIMLSLCVLPWTHSLIDAARTDPNAASGKKWRVALITWGPFSDYVQVFQGFAQRLAELGYIPSAAIPLPEDGEDLRPMWMWLSENAVGAPVEFIANAFYSPERDKNDAEATIQSLVSRLKNDADIDVVLAFGTWAGKACATDDITVPVFVCSATNALEAGIIQSVGDSGRNNLFAAVEIGRTAQQVRIFHNFLGFTRLGIAYENTPDDMASIALGEIETAAADLGVELVRCTDQFNIPDLELSSNRLLACHESLVQRGAQAVYVTYNDGMAKKEKIPELLAPFAKAGISSFSQLGSAEVQKGVLLGMSQASLRDEGGFSAEAMVAVMGGKSPRELSQRFESILSLAVNIRMATLIGWNPSLEKLAAVDEFYQDM